MTTGKFEAYYLNSLENLTRKLLIYILNYFTLLASLSRFKPIIPTSVGCHGKTYFACKGERRFELWRQHVEKDSHETQKWILRIPKKEEESNKYKSTNGQRIGQNRDMVRLEFRSSRTCQHLFGLVV